MVLRRAAVLLATWLAGVSLTAPVSAAPKCFGRTATIIGTQGKDSIQGTGSADVIIGLAGNDTIDALGGRDRVCGGRGRDIIWGDHPDFLTRPAGDRLRGGPGRDWMNGVTGDDLLIGKAGADDLCGGNGADRSRGGPGRDRFSCPFGDDVFRGGAGADTVDYFFFSGSTTVDLRLTSRQETGWGNQRFLAVENLDGPVDEAAHFIGNAAPNVFFLSFSADVADGGGGPDRLIGRGGADNLDGGGNDDVLKGGAGGDTGNGGPHFQGDRCLSIETSTGCEITG
jgi:Ca2+-binding RTX toxin-like protein